MKGMLDQFNTSPLCITPVGTITDGVLTALLIPCIFALLACIRVRTLPTPIQRALELVYEWVSDQLGPDAQQYLSLMVTVFFFVATANLLGTIPSLFALTSHFSVTCGLGFCVWLIATLTGILFHTRSFIQHFFVPGLPQPIVPFVALIELTAYCIRPITLGARLGINMIAGHVLLEVLADLATSAGYYGIFGLGLMVFVSTLELMVCVIQAGVFTILGCLYLKETCH